MPRSLYGFLTIYVLLEKARRTTKGDTRSGPSGVSQGSVSVRIELEEDHCKKTDAEQVFYGHCQTRRPPRPRRCRRPTEPAAHCGQ